MFLYIAKNPSTCVTKIGFSSCPTSRVRAFKGFQLEFTIQAHNEAIARAAEHVLKKKFKPWVHSGNEWFKFPENISVVKTMQRVVSKTIEHHAERRVTYEEHYRSQEARILKDLRRGKKTPEYILKRSRMYRTLLIVEHKYNPEQLKEYF